MNSNDGDKVKPSKGSSSAPVTKDSMFDNVAFLLPLAAYG
jgi:hypothetical protein